MNNNHIAHMLRQRASKYGTREVFRYKEKETYQSISWNSFASQAEIISTYLLSEGIQTDAKIGIYSQNCPQWTISDLAILSIRAVVVPFYPTATHAQLKYIIDETDMEVLFVGENDQLDNAIEALTKTESLKRIITFNCRLVNHPQVVALDTILKGDYSPHKAIFDQQFHAASENDLATIIYTSGTTGEPKGVMLHHKQFMCAFEIHDKRLTLGEDDVSMCFLPLSHVFERTWTYYLLHSGGTNIYNLDPKQIIDELPKAKPTVMCVVPRFFEKTYDAINHTANTWIKPQKAVFNWAVSVGQQYIEFEKDNKKAPFFLQIKRTIANALVYKKVRQVFGGKIRYMPCAGSALNNHLLRFFHGIGLYICYGYGATETTATVSCMPTANYDFEYSGNIMPNLEVKINDEGMILVKGDTVFTGYYKKPTETAEVLKDGWYYTGDQGSMPQTGKLHMTERIKDIIKTSTGKYISPQKVELVLLQGDLIEQICVIGDNRKYLSALIVPALSPLKAFANKQGIAYQNNTDLVNNPRIIHEVEKQVNTLQSGLPKHEKVAKITLLDQTFSIDNSMLTNSLKVRRKQVNIAYHKEISCMY